MLDKLKEYTELHPFFTTNLFENGVGVIIDPSIPESQYIAINVDKYYHKLSLPQTPAIVDLLIVGKNNSEEKFHIFIVEMKNINGENGFKCHNIYEKFTTVIEDFMKIRYQDPFLNEKYNVIECKLFFINDAYHFSENGYTKDEYSSFLKGTKIEILQSMPPFEYRGFYLFIDYEIPNPLLKW